MSGWQRNPIVGVVLVLVIAATAYFVVSQFSGNGTTRDPLAGDAVTLICPHDGEVFKVPRAQLGVGAEADPDQIQGKIREVACPKCSKKECVLPVYCRSCSKPFASPKTATKIKEFKCPHCGKSPWGR
ncbi:hypothetical protein ACFL09_04175 [Planctomycetota bacterium]